ncbi:Mitochondrial import inner membrane translocase subunit Tim17 family protein [Tritrichomonas foetus]|uniref:Mitochondrial import inner membrane translocase subunit TIM22 n=1 Tax=Tritrichomonas foetus TaxID=1144522 RepID=A0A1J4J2M2_9EUKA|nr:Mitochondrial import inner membrane translocase subunit Tim17 family protein [Tritrichomonas foetus]|eukprot:OHS93688.1 Mitochondrial import inner membrane translocase subunit Tim17 family protein [Tritrichomonas foetus]
MSERVTRPLNNETRKPVKFHQEEEPNRFKMSMNPDPNMVNLLARYLLPITQEEVLNREFGESPVLKAINTTLTTGALGFAIGAGKYAFETFPQKDAIFSAKDLTVSGLKMGAYFGIQAGITDLIETSMSTYRGRARAYDKVVAGAMAGAICGIPDGVKGMKSGAAQGATFAVGMVALQTLQEWMM